jgi:hypothetical protein
MPDAAYAGERSAVVPAPPQRAFDLVADAGIGAVYEWSGNRTRLRAAATSTSTGSS